MKLRTIVVLASCGLLVSSSAYAASVPVGFSDHEIAGGLTSPTSLTALPDGRVLVVQQNGVILIVEDDTLLARKFWEVPNVDASGERGCLGITPDPDFATNHFIYLYCTIETQTSNNRVIRVTERDDRIDDASAKVLLELPPVTSTWHMGGALRFGRDGMLYVAVGNHEDNPQPVETANSQNLSSPFGKILRIQSNGDVPSDNPFVDTPDAEPAIWSYGYRNPFAFDIQPGTGRTLVGDVGQSTWEEIDDNERAANYGWPEVEGPSDNAKYEAPLYAYKHDDSHCSITGAAFYNPRTAQFPDAYLGTFLFADFCGGTIQSLDLATDTPRAFVTGIGFPTNIAVASDGSLYYLSRNQDTKTFDPGVGSLNKIEYTGTAAPRISRHPTPQTILLGQPVTFEVSVDGADQLQWQRDGSDIDGATQRQYTIDQTRASDDGAVFVVVASNQFGDVSSDPARLTITSNRPPIAAITQPAQSGEYAPGDMLSFTGSGTDDADGDLPASAFTWQVDFQHDTHSHPLLAAMSGSRTVSFGVPDTEASAANTWLRVHLSVRDSAGASHSVYRDVYPRAQLSSLTPLDPVMNGVGPVERDHSNGDSEVDGKPLSVGGIAFPKGLGVSAPADLRFDLGGRCSGKFLADVGVDDEVGDQGSVVFRVLLDDAQVYDSGTKRGSDARSSVDVDVAGAKQLRLVVTDSGDGADSDHADWGGARVTGCVEAASGGPAAGSGAISPGSGTPSAGSTPPMAGSGAMAEDSAGEGGAQAPVDRDGAAGKTGTRGDPLESDNDAGAGSSGGPSASGSGKPAHHDDDGCTVTRLGRGRVDGVAWFALLGLLTLVRVRVRGSGRRPAQDPTPAGRER